MYDYYISVKGNDGFQASLRIADAESIEQAIDRACKILGELTIEQFIEVTAKQL